MSSPTPGSDPNHVQGGAPQGQPGWGAPQQPDQPYGGPAPSYPTPPAGFAGAPEKRPAQVTAAAVIGIVIGGLGVLGGLLSLAGLGVVFAFDAFLGLLLLLSLAAAVVVLVGGIQAIRGQSPKLLVLGCYASIAVSLLALIWSIASGWGFNATSLFSFILPIAIVALLRQPQSKQYFAARGITY